MMCLDQELLTEPNQPILPLHHATMHVVWDFCLAPVCYTLLDIVVNTRFYSFVYSLSLELLSCKV